MSIGTLDVIDRLPIELQARLEADEFFSDIPVVVAEEGNVLLELERKQAVITAKAGRRGAAVIVLQCLATDPYEEVAFGPLLLKPALQVVESLDLNRGPEGTGKSARRIARQVHRVIKPLELRGICTAFAPDTPCIEPVNVKDANGLVRVYQCNYTTFEADAEQTELVATPEFAQGEGATVMLHCGTADAQIWYTIDEDFPAPGRAGSRLYVEPIEVSAGGLTIRAAGYKAGAIASQVARATVNAS